MRGMNVSAKICVGIGLSLTAAIPVAHATAPVAGRPETFYSAQALKALDQRWNAEARHYYPTRAMRALDARWEAEACSFVMRPARARVLHCPA
jgi:hypothetical protein